MKNVFKALFKSKLFVFTLLGCVVFCLSIYLYTRWDLARFRASLSKAPQSTSVHVEALKPTETEAPVLQQPTQGHVHEDGTVHAKPHESPEPMEASPQETYKPPPGAATEPDFPAIDPNEDPVEAAYKRLDYIKNNPYAWGGVHSERATELIAQLMPPPVLVSHDQGEEVYALIEELIVENDPRAAAVLITNICDGSISTDSMENALVAIGPPAVPYILPYLEKGVTEGGMVSSSVFDTLRSIAVDHRADLGGITEHIIIPKIAEIASDKNFDRHDSGTVFFATAALSLLRR